MATEEPSAMETFAKFTNRNYARQAQAFLNAFWEEHRDEAERIWDMARLLASLDKEKGADGMEVDEFTAHRFLEKLGETLTVVEFRKVMREVDIDFNKRMALIEFLLFHYKKSVETFVERPQGTNEALIDAQDALERVKEEVEKIESKKRVLAQRCEALSQPVLIAREA
eukprot:TRINITY_DN19015_c0_g1_i1.p2 TRINITY_DN19015_c0_g1~~TRINITY_DN19015_c0_g1_i1.p2  ORF type:complete len:169 (+),score=24.04 TRINITY_DN19015_c0_g1_i1:144-650(+)